MKVKDINKTSAWCSKIIAPRTYYIHNKLGGKGWRIIQTGNGWELIIDNKNQALLALLKFSDTL